MIVTIDSNLFQIEEAFDDLDKLVDIFISGKHFWLIKDPEGILNSRWVSTETNSRLGRKVELLVKEAVRGLYLGTAKRNTTIKVKIGLANSPEMFDIKIGLAFLSDSLFVILENPNSDRLFLEAICHAYSHSVLIEAIDKGWVQFDSEGGLGGIPRRIEAHFRKPFKPRLYVIVDSGRLHPGDSHKAGKVCEHCDGLGVKYSVLHKRAIENYIPEIAFDGLPAGLDDVINAYRQLNDDQKDYYDLKKGFNNKGTIPKEQSSLFEGMTSKDDLFKALRKGFSRGINPNELYKCFAKRDKLTATHLTERCRTHPDELRILINDISTLL